VYIGQTTKTLKRRKSQHAFRTKKGDKRTPFYLALLDLGFSAFQWEQIDTAETADELDEKEKQWIAYYQSDNPAHGYNGTDGGVKTSYSDEARRKMSEWQTGRKLSPKHHQKISEGMKRAWAFGKFIHRKSQGTKGKSPTLETRKKISKALKGRKLSPEHCHKMSETQKGRVVSDETRQKMSMSAKRRCERKKLEGGQS
jgi:group I intron endonuclease